MSARYDVIVAGGGIAGMVAAGAFGSAGFTTLLIDPAPPVTDGASAEADTRSTAFLRAGRDLFQRIGVWDHLSAHATPLDALRIVDCAGDPPVPRGERSFVGEEAGGEPFGWNLLNWQVRATMLAALERMDNVTLRFGTGFAGVTTRLDAAIVQLSDGSRARARLLIGADGRGSPVRAAVGIEASLIRYGQTSLAFTATHDLPHGNVSTEIYNEGGPFTMVPLADVGGRPASAIVWMNRTPVAAGLRDLPEPAFNEAMTRRSAGLFGDMRLASRRGSFPIVTQRAASLTARRTALIAEAAHVLPPIGAQGLNTSLNDIAQLLAQAEAAPGALGNAAMLDAYAARRGPDIAARARAIDLFNRVTRAPDALTQGLRLAGLRLAHDVPPLRDRLMRAGLNPL